MGRADAEIEAGQPGGQGRRLGRLSRWLTHRRLPVFLTALALLLAGPSLWVGWVADDHAHRIIMLGWSGLPEFEHPLWDLFTFADGDPERTGRVMDLGVWPWWTLPEVRAAFMRPATAVTHWLDYRLWPERPALMHAQSLLWFGAMVAAAAVLYRRLMGATVVGGLAALLFAVDDAHGMPLGFLANRNAIIATFFGLLTIIAHDSWRRDRRRVGAVLGPLLLAASLLSAEIGLSAMAYVAAYALVLEQGTWRRRLMSLLPCAGVVLAWRMVWTHLGYGVHGIGLYVDPAVEPLRFAAAAVQRIPGLLLGQWALPPAGVYYGMRVMLPDWAARLVWPVATMLVVLMAVVLIRRLDWNATARFWACGMSLSLLPICATAPSDRLLLFVGLGAFGLIAQFLGTVFTRGDSFVASQRGRLRRWPAVTLGALFVLVHGLVGPVLLAVRASMPVGPKRLLNQMYVNTPLDESVEQQDVVVVSAPIALAAGYLPIMRAAEGLPVPRHTRVLSASWSPVAVTRRDTHTLVVRPDWGYLGTPADELARDQGHPMSLGQRVELTGMTAEVTALTDDGRPAEAGFEFTVPLEDASLRWLTWREGEFVPFVPPAVGETVNLPAAIPAMIRLGS